MQPFSQVPGNADPSTVGSVRAHRLHQGGQPAISGVRAEIPVAHTGIAIRGVFGSISGREVNAVAGNYLVEVCQRKLRPAESVRKPCFNVGYVVEAIGGLNAL